MTVADPWKAKKEIYPDEELFVNYGVSANTNEKLIETYGFTLNDDSVFEEIIFTRHDMIDACIQILFLSVKQCFDLVEMVSIDSYGKIGMFYFILYNLNDDIIYRDVS